MATPQVITAIVASLLGGGLAHRFGDQPVYRWPTGCSSAPRRSWGGLRARGARAGPLALAPLFDSVGRKKMISSTYLVSGILLAVSAWLFGNGDLTVLRRWPTSMASRTSRLA